MSTLTEKAAEILAYLDKNTKPNRGDGDTPTVSELLARSRASHEIYRRSLRHRVNGITVDGNVQAAAEAVATSARLRMQAELRDPRHEDAAWVDDMAAKFPHTAMVQFYEDEVKYYVPVIAEAKPVEVEPVPDVPPAEDAKPKSRRKKANG